MNRAAMQRILQGPPTAPAAVVVEPSRPAGGDDLVLHHHDADPLADLLRIPIRKLTAPLPVASSILGCTIHLVANDTQAAAVRVQGGIPYTADEIDVLWALHQTTSPEAWGDNLRLIHEAKRRFAGTVIPETQEET